MKNDIEKHLREIMELHQQINAQSFADIVRRLEPLDMWPSRMDALANEIRDLQNTRAMVEGKGDQKDVEVALRTAASARLIGIAGLLFGLINIILRMFGL